MRQLKHLLLFVLTISLMINFLLNNCLQYLQYNNFNSSFFTVNITISLSIALFNTLVFLIFSYYNPSYKYAYNRVALVLTIFGLYWLSILFFKNMQPVIYLQHKIVVNINYGFAILNFIALAIISGMYSVKKFQEQIQAYVIEAEKLKQEAELISLKQQLQPHFLFNSLNSINALTLSDPSKAAEMVQKLADFLRLVLRSNQSEMVSLKSEIQLVEIYLAIEKVRFPNRLNFKIDVDENLLLHLIPQLLLQPLIENAIKFSLYSISGESAISLKIIKKNNNLVISITNPYDSDGQSTSISGEKFGLNYIQRKLFLMYKRNDLLHFKKTNNLFEVRLQIPIAT